jgi:subtilisin family serine protease
VRTHVAALILALALVVAAALTGSPVSAAMAEDRLVVTIKLPGVNGSMVSPSGRMSYLPPNPAERRKHVAQQAREIAAEFDLVIEEEWPIPAIGVNCIVVRLQFPERREQVMDALSMHEDVDAVQSLNLFTASTAQSVSRGIDQGVEHNVARNVPGADILQQLSSRASGRQVSIAVIDTGADLAHRELRGMQISSRDLVEDESTTSTAFPPEAHGTTILGLLVARGENGVGVRGHVPDADVRLLRACWEETDTGSPAKCNTFTLAKALSDVIESPVDIVNLSISGPRDPLLERLGNILTGKQVLVVAAGDSRNGFPGSVSGSLLAVESPLRNASAMSLLPGNRYGLRKGSSIDAIRLTAVLALLKELHPDVTADNLMTYLDAHARDRENVTSSNKGI